MVIIQRYLSEQKSIPGSGSDYIKNIRKDPTLVNLARQISKMYEEIKKLNEFITESIKTRSKLKINFDPNNMNQDLFESSLMQLDDEIKEAKKRIGNINKNKYKFIFKFAEAYKKKLNPTKKAIIGSISIASAVAIYYGWKRKYDNNRT